MTTKRMSAGEFKALAMKFAGSALTIPETADLFRHIAALRAVKPEDVSDEQVRVFFRVMEGDKRLGEDFNARGRRAIAAAIAAGGAQ